ncbi:MAG: right-handed parallel beta-helix repeat-containing protein [Prolixibacteraceae bacterium]
MISQNKHSLFFMMLTFLFISTAWSQESSSQFQIESYVRWNDSTVYNKTYVVNKNHPKASDENKGSEEEPLLTINQAAQLVQSGERVLIHAGVYREMIQPLTGGHSASKMILFEGAEGENVIVSGARVWEAKWQQKQVLISELSDETLSYAWSRKIWKAELPEQLFENNYLPFQLKNIEPSDFPLMPWAQLCTDKAPYQLTRGLLFQNGKRMVQLESYGDLTRIPGSFWVHPNGKAVHIHSFENGDPNTSIFEIGVQSHLFNPQKVGLAYLHIKGITFEKCANGFLRSSTGAVNAKGGHHWIIENNTIRQVNSSGLEFGYVAFEKGDPSTMNQQPRLDDNLGGMMIRNNIIQHCGTAGMRSYMVKDAIVENNTIADCGWHDAENYWEVAAIKLLRCDHTLVNGNLIYNMQGGNGIWLDWDNRYSRVTGNVIYDVQTVQGAIFIEASIVPNLVDNNFIWNIDGNGIYLNDTDQAIVVHNLVGRTTGPVVSGIASTGRKMNGRLLSCKQNQIYYNLFVDVNQPVHFAFDENSTNYNCFVSANSMNFSFESNPVFFRKGAQDSRLNAHVEFDPKTLYFFFKTDMELPHVIAGKYVVQDFFGKMRSGQATVPGPFENLTSNYKIILK